MTTVTCVGLAVRDLIFEVPRLHTGPGKLLASSRFEEGGGPAATGAVTVAALGGTARFVGALGDDEVGRSLRGDLEAVGVDVDNVRIVAGVASPLSVVTVEPGGERAIVNHSDPALFTRARRIEPADLSGSDAILADIRWEQGARDALSWAKENGVAAVLDYDIGGAGATDLMDLASHTVFSQDALERMTDETDHGKGLHAIARRVSTWVAVTAGEQGTYWLDSGDVRHMPAFGIDVVDTTGAGDVYHGAFALMIASRVGVEEAIRFASAAAAISCTRLGGRAGIPDRAHVEALLKEQR